MKRSTILSLIAGLFVFLIISGCSAGPMSGTVVDAENGQPIEGAVIHVQWSESKGMPGMSYGELYKIEEAVSDANGKFRLEGVDKYFFIRPPKIVIYKKGYVAWRHDFIFPDYQKREPFQWKDGQVFKLEHFKKYSHSQHISFIRIGLSLDSAMKLDQSFASEILLAQKERELYSSRLAEFQRGEKTERELWLEIINELYDRKGELK
jgi:hypothetical protein